MTVLQLGPDLRWIGLFEGYGGLSAGIMAVTGGHLVAVAEYEPPKLEKRTGRLIPGTQAPARLLAHRQPEIPNLGDVGLIDWEPWAGQVDGMCGGFPCQDVSHAGLRAGLGPGTRSGTWSEFARGIAVVRPALVVIENVPGLRSARAGDQEEAVDDEETWDMEPGNRGVGRPERDDRPLRALGAVLGDLAELGYDAEWGSLRASDVGASHRRERVFIMGYRSDLTGITG